MENLNSYMERLEWRRNKVLELSSQGHSQTEIANTLHISEDEHPIRYTCYSGLSQKHTTLYALDAYQECYIFYRQIMKI